MEIDGKMGVHLDGSIDGGVSRLEVIEGPSGRRRRTKGERARIAVESLMPGVTVADVARRLERLAALQRLPEQRERSLHVRPETVGQRCRHHALALAHEQRIAELAAAFGPLPVS